MVISVFFLFICFNFREPVGPFESASVIIYGRDTIVGNPNVINGSSQIWGTQSALIYTPRVSGFLDTLSLHYLSINNINMTQSRVYISTANAASCNGPASDFGDSPYTIGASAFIDPIAGEWNDYVFENVYLHQDSTYYIWPDLIPQISHRISWADASFGNIDMKATFPGLCTVIQADYSALFHISLVDCPVVHVVIDADCEQYLAQDTLRSEAIIASGKTIRYSSSGVTELSPNFQVDQLAQLEIDTLGCLR